MDALQQDAQELHCSRRHTARLLLFFRQIMQGTANIIDAFRIVVAHRNVDVVCIMRLICTAVCRTAVMRNRLPAFRNPLRKGIYFLTL